MPILIAAVGLLGLVIGSFLNVVIYRVPRGESLVRPGSHCTDCGQPVRARHNVPLVSWVMLRGQCARLPRRNQRAIPAGRAGHRRRLRRGHCAGRAPGTARGAARIPLLRRRRHRAHGIDLDVFRLPNAIVYPSYIVLGGLLGLASILDGSLEPLVRAAIGAAAMFAFYFALVIVHPAGMGFGDVKLSGVIGAALGFLSYPALLVGAFAAFVIGGLVGVGLMLLRHATRKTALPFGPSMLAGAFLAIFASVPLVDAYSHFVQRA